MGSQRSAGLPRLNGVMNCGGLGSDDVPIQTSTIKNRSGSGYSVVRREIWDHNRPFGFGKKSSAGSGEKSV